LKRLNQLPEIANEMLGGITAGPELLTRIVTAPPRKRRAPLFVRRVAALALSAAMVLGLALGLPTLLYRDDQAIITQAAGNLPAGGRTRALDVPRGSIKLVNTGTAPGYQGVWASGSGANFPLVRVQGRYYRLLTNPTSAGDSVGGQVGEVTVYTSEPALDNADIVSNVVAQGEKVYDIAGMKGAAVAAPVDGVMRVFQRVSFSGSALVGSEGLSATLGSASSVKAMQLSGVGTVTDSTTIQSLMGTLLNNASYQGSGSRTTNQALLIEYNNGIVLQMAVNGNKLSACGTWACPEFIQAFTAAVQ
jgi:hypothetical protein